MAHDVDEGGIREDGAVDPAARGIGRTARGSALYALPFAVATVLIAVVLMVLGADVEIVLSLLLALSLIAPALVELVLRTPLPRPLQLHYHLFMILGPFAGSALHVYWIFPAWDTLVHVDSGVMLAWLGMLAVRRAEQRAGSPLPVWFGLCVAQMTAMAFAAAWELCEWGSDLIIGTAAQHGLSDTMEDIFAGTFGGILAIVLFMILRRPRSVAPQSLLDAWRRG